MTFVNFHHWWRDGVVQNEQPTPRITKLTRKHAHFVGNDQITPFEINDLWGQIHT